MMASAPRLRDIAARIGVSTATVSNALSGTGRVSATLAERIREEVAAIGFVPRHAAHALRTGHSGLIGLILPNITNPLFPSFAQAIEHAAKARGLAVLFADSRTARTSRITRSSICWPEALTA